MNNLVDHALDAKITILTRELLTTSSKVCWQVKDMVTNKKVSLNVVELDEVDSYIAEFLNYSDESDPASVHLDLSKYDPSSPSAVAFLPVRVIRPSFGPGVEPECILDGGAQVVIMRKDIWEQLRPPIILNKAMAMESANSGTTVTLGLLKEYPVQLGPITVYLQIQVVENAPFEVLLGHPSSMSLAAPRLVVLEDTIRSCLNSLLPSPLHYLSSITTSLSKLTRQ